MIEDFDRCYRAAASRDSRFDGWFFTAVTSTGIYCRPSCPALTPKRDNVRFFRTAAAAQGAGFRACRRCRPDASPGSPEWNVRSDVVARAMRLIADGAVDRGGVEGLAARLGYSVRQLHRLLTAEVGAGPLALARAQRAQAARTLIETTALPMAAVAFAAGFASIRQFNDTVRSVFAATPSDLRRAARHTHATVDTGPLSVSLRLAYRRPFAKEAWLRFLSARLVAGVETIDGRVYRRSLRLPHGAAAVALSDDDGAVRCLLALDDHRDLVAAVNRCRRLLDLDADPMAVHDALADDPHLRPAVRREPGRRVIGSVDGTEVAVRTVLGQQVSVAGARTTAGRLTGLFGKPLTRAVGGVTHLFPDAATLADADIGQAGLTRRRAAAVRALATAIAEGAVDLDGGADPTQVRDTLQRLPGVGPWTTEYVALRALRDPDAFPATDLGLRKAAERVGIPSASLDAHARRWRPWRAYAAEYLWSTLEGTSR